MKFTRFVVLLIGIFLSGCPLPIPHERPITPVLHGTIFDGSTGKPLSGVLVTLRARSDLEPAVTKSDDAGRYEIGIFEHASVYLITPPMAEGACGATVTYSRQNYKSVTRYEGWFGSAALDGPSSAIPSIPSDGMVEPDARKSGAHDSP